MIIFKKVIVENLLICLKYNVVKLFYFNIKRIFFFFYVFLKLNSYVIFDVL